MSIERSDDLKKEFQIERIAFFSDAVFAIAITLLVIEFRPPIISKGTTHEEMWHHLSELKLKFAALVLSFVLVIGYWIRHHTLFKYIHNYNKKVIMANMLMLLPVIFFPFTTSFLYESIGSENMLMMIPYRLFLLNHVIAGAAMYFFYFTVTKRFKECCSPMSKEHASEFENKIVIMSFSFLLVFGISFVSFQYSALGLIPFAAYNFYLKFILKKRATALPKKHAEQKDSAAD